MKARRRSAHGSLEERGANTAATAYQRPLDADRPPNQPLHCISTIAKRLNVSEKSVRRYIARGQLPAYKIGGQIRISDEDVNTLLMSSRVSKNHE
jgi:excisionase family DNA binding protein